MLETTRLLRTGKDIARRHSLINRIRIGVVRIMRVEGKGSEPRRLTEELLTDIEREVELNRERCELEAELGEIYREFLAELARSCPELTESERTILLLTHAGFSTKEIADILYITTRGVQTHRYRAGRKMKKSRLLPPFVVVLL